jgi:hypothetical protein
MEDVATAAVGNVDRKALRCHTLERANEPIHALQ